MSVTLETKTLIIMDPERYSDYTETKAIAGDKFSSETIKNTIGFAIVCKRLSFIFRKIFKVETLLSV